VFKQDKQCTYERNIDASPRNHRRRGKARSITGIYSDYVAHLRQVSQLNISDFSGETFKGFDIL